MLQPFWKRVWAFLFLQETEHLPMAQNLHSWTLRQANKNVCAHNINTQLFMSVLFYRPNLETTKMSFEGQWSTPLWCILPTGGNQQCPAYPQDAANCKSLSQQVADRLDNAISIAK